MKHPPFAASVARDLEALPFADRVDLAATTRAALLAAAEATGAPALTATDLDALAAAVEGAALGVYLEGRVNGLCHDGALELFRDAACLAATVALGDRVERAP